MKNNNGITLIALVITIIILIILATVSINLFFKDSGIISRAKDAQESMDVATIKEKVKLEIIDKISEKNGQKITQEELKEILTEPRGDRRPFGTLKNNTENILDDILVTEKGYEISVRDLYENDFSDKIVQNTKWTQVGVNITGSNGEKLVVGDKVLYNCKSEAKNKSITSYMTETGYTKNQDFNIDNYSGEWYVLGVENEKLLLISSDIKTKDNEIYYLYGQKGIENSVNELNKIAELYGQSSFVDSVRSVKREDINKITGYDPMKTGYNVITNQGEDKGIYAKGTLQQYANTVKYSLDGSVYPLYEGSNGMTGRQTKNHNDDNFKNRYSYYLNNTWTNVPFAETNGINVTLNCNCYFYYPETLESTKNDSASIGLAQGTKAHNNLFLYKENDNILNKYWIADTYTETKNWRVYFGVYCIDEGMLHHGSMGASDGYETTYGNGVRSVITLKSNVKLSGDGKTGYLLSFN